MTVTRICCDMCGAELENHGRRYVMSLAKLPTVRLVGSMSRYDLCETCAARLKVRMGRSQAKNERIERWGNEED